MTAGRTTTSRASAGRTTPGRRPTTPGPLPASAGCPCGGRTPSALRTPRDLSVLTDREAEVLRLVGAGLGNLPIALQLGITERTVKKHVSGVLEKLNVRSRLEAGLVAVLQHEQLCRRTAAGRAADSAPNRAGGPGTAPARPLGAPVGRSGA
ncbi:helix-turn-helix transcriptional regulator [Kitasatospora purpeofusca]|uniref:helix-turn-helix domain-containing protein n=1 Tax=Kitasatospora purpeofusca TaxID=67352 RepID=UPI003691FBA3